jgi:hypothetical protein
MISSIMWLIKPKKYNNNQYYAKNHLGGGGMFQKTVLLDEKLRTLFMYTLQGPQVLGWAARECPLHCPDPSLLRATSTKSSVARQIERGQLL